MRDRRLRCLARTPLLWCGLVLAQLAGAQDELAAAQDGVELWAGAALPESVEGLLSAGLEAYERGIEGQSRDARLEGFRRAERLFAEAESRGAVSAPLYTNLGNAALQAENLGPAVLAFRRALRLDPSHAQAGQNLRYARAQLPHWVPTPPEGGLLDSFFFWHRSVSFDRRALLASGLFGLASLLAIPAIAWRRSGFRNAAFVPLAAWAVLVASLSLDPARSAVPEGVVIAREAIARAADSANAPLRFTDPLPGGTEVRILEVRGSWLQVALYNGRTGWVAASSIERITRVGAPQLDG